MQKQWCRQNYNGASDDPRYATNRLTQLQLLGPHHGHGLIAEATLDDCGAKDVHQILDRDRSDRFLAHSDLQKQRHGVQRMTQMIEHVVATPVDHPGLDHRVIES